MTKCKTVRLKSLKCELVARFRVSLHLGGTMKRWSEVEEGSLARAYGGVLSGMASGCRPPPDRVYAEFIRCNGGATTRSRKAVVVKAGALWSACRAVRAFDRQRSRGQRPWFSLGLAEKRVQSRRMRSSKGLVSLAESVYGIFDDISPSRAAEAPRRQQVREAPSEQPAEAAGVPRHQQVREAQPEQPAEAAKPHGSEAHKERHLDLNSPHEWPSPKNRHLESACTSDARVR